MTLRARVLEALGHGLRPRARRADHDARLRRAPATCRDDGDVDVRLRLPTPQCAPNFAFLMAADARAAIVGVPGVRRGDGRARGPLHGSGDQRRGRPAAGASATRSRGRRRASWTRCARCSTARRCVARQSRVCQACWRPGRTREEVRAARRRPARGRRTRGAASSCAARSARARRTVRLRSCAGDGAPVAAGDLTAGCAAPPRDRLSLEANGGICRALLRGPLRHAPTEEVAA